MNRHKSLCQCEKKGSRGHAFPTAASRKEGKVEEEEDVSIYTQDRTFIHGDQERSRCVSFQQVAFTGTHISIMFWPTSMQGALMSEPEPHPVTVQPPVKQETTVCHGPGYNT